MKEQTVHHWVAAFKLLLPMYVQSHGFFTPECLPPQPCPEGKWRQAPATPLALPLQLQPSGRFSPTVFLLSFS